LLGVWAFRGNCQPKWVSHSEELGHSVNRLQVAEACREPWRFRPHSESWT